MWLEMLELADWELETTMINMLKALMGRLEYTQKQMGNVIREMEILRENGKQCGKSKRRAEPRMLCRSSKPYGVGLKKGERS